MRVLNVAQNKDTAKTVAQILSSGATGNEYRNVYEFNYQVQQLGKCDMIFTSVAGHLTQLGFTDTHSMWQSCLPAVLFDAPIEPKIQGHSEFVRNKIQDLIKSCNDLIIWTDCDREGENIGLQIITICTEIKPDIRVHRARFMEISVHAITNAVNHLEQPDKNSAEAVEIRKQLDLRIGAAFTRLQTLFLESRVFLDEIVSYGSCQIPTLGLIVERFKERERFVVEPFWYLEVKHSKDNIAATFNWERFHLNVKPRVDAYLRRVTAEEAVAIGVDVTHNSMRRPYPMNSATLQSLCSKYLGMTSRETMEVAMKLYRAGLISHPKTGSDKFPPDFDFRMYIEPQSQSQLWGCFAQKLLDDGITPRNGKDSEKALPPIYPTQFTASLLNQAHEGAEVYELICRHFLATCSKDAQKSETTVEIEINGEQFYTTGIKFDSLNYLDVYKYEEVTEIAVPSYQVGETFVPDSVSMEAGHSTPPPLLAESDLVELMQKHGIGTDSTQAAHIEKIKDRMYVELTDDHPVKFKPTPLGLGLIEGYNKINEEISKPHLRARLEKDLQAVCEGRKNAKLVLLEHISEQRKLFERLSANLDLLGHEVESRVGSNKGCGEPAADSANVPCTPRKRKFDGEGHQCYCKVEANGYIVKKDSPHKGRKFFKCAYGRCTYWKWESGGTSPNIPVKQPTTSRPNNPLAIRQINFSQTTIEVAVDSGNGSDLGLESSLDSAC